MAADPKSPTPESPTTARPLEMDDDDVQDASIQPDEGVASKTATPTTAAAPSGDAAAAPAAAAAQAAGAEAAAPPDAEDAAPPKPPRPLTEQQKKEQTLREAFPAVDAAVVRAVLTASRGNIEAAFHALLEMTDPGAVEQEPTPPPQPPRPAVSPNSQMLADEEYARQLAERYENEDGRYEARTSRAGYGGYGAGGGRTRHYPPPRGAGETGLKPNEMWGDKEHSFIDDDLPVLRENLRKGFAETQTKFSTWFTGIKKKIDEEWIGNDDDDDNNNNNNEDGRPPRPGAGAQGAGRQSYGRGGYGNRPPPRRSGDYDADPELLTDDFAGIQLHGDGTPVRQNPNVFRPPPSSTSPRPGSERKVAFRDQDETMDMYSASPKLPPKDGAGTTASPPSSGTKASKWQPMSSVDPTPMADNDPFSLGDSEDEKDAAAAAAASKTGAAGKGEAAPAAAGPAEGAKSSTSSTSPEDAERLRQAAAEAMADSLVDDQKAKA